MSAENTVSIVIPAYNAEVTLGETLDSVRRQSWRALEIIVVDDGSTDRTAEVARAHAAEDSRVRLLRVENGGVASARNAGIAASRGAFVAPVDADDLWHPEKIARQMAVMKRDDGIGYVYTFFRRIDPQGDVLPSGGEGTRIEGAAYLRSLLYNFVGNGSSLLIRRLALNEAGGYDPDLRRRGVQGCEDYLLQIMIARTWRVACVPEYLTGYRIAPDAMSADRGRMARSKLAMLAIAARRFPETPPDALALAEASVLAYLSALEMRRRRPREAGRALAGALRRAPVAALAVVADQARQTLRGRLGLSTLFAPASDGPRPPFWAVDPVRDVPPRHPQPLARQLRALAGREEAIFTTPTGGAAPAPWQGRGYPADDAVIPVRGDAPEATGRL
jgi:hypothetical protein